MVTSAQKRSNISAFGPIYTKDADERTRHYLPIAWASSLALARVSFDEFVVPM
jgi:hypothetical protein